MLHEVNDMKDKQLNVRLTADEVAAAQKLAERYETNVAGLIRKLLRDAESTLSMGWRWSHVKEEALRYAKEADIPNLRMWFDDDWRVIYLDDGVDAMTVSGGFGVWPTLAYWPASKLGPNAADRVYRKRLNEDAVERFDHKDPPAFATPPRSKPIKK